MPVARALALCPLYALLGRQTLGRAVTMPREHLMAGQALTGRDQRGLGTPRTQQMPNRSA
ncbi:hypothetical protein GCM10009733_006600 [Nonomuraea maheshkhaliensis]|uniref:Uncharacterized protein n=1 Tax=Nonomuraea maheshkhaliensis TaxID=419590 RepID=A0ABP4QJJ2_9ACTN